ncbi:hexokinase-domain-containing protein [Kickxella alabastrina]|uniref:hexokinase-domain-containing protein n=1 Tax=Kickxella alabastrina TaxID=61397 RepID=UPI00221E8238|nr:hexokinase-domain-containing protein [Kickxella alabastrina]KAI7823702.1 hexokinase-domain-containing protein [Kickxella alabastrina]
MIPTFVRRRPSGKETGTFLALDLGGTNLRVCQVTLNGDTTYSLVQQKFTITQDAKESRLWDFIADCVGIFLEEHGLSPAPGKRTIPCGYTFSFPIFQTGIASGNLSMWNKGFTVPNSVGRDVVNLTQSAFQRNHVPVEVVAVLNDTVGTLMTSGYSHPDTQMGIIFGTGTNAAYWENMENIPKWTGADRKGEMVVNMEWGAFDNATEVLPYTMHDNKLNRKSSNHGLQVFEKMISGLFLGEVARNAILSLVDQRLLFEGRSSEILNKSYTFDTAYMSEIVADDSKDLRGVKTILESTLDIPPTTFVDRQVVKNVCGMIGTRGVRLSAAAMSAVLLSRPELMENPLSVGIDGSMYQFYPNFEKDLYNVSRTFLGDDFVNNRLRLHLAKDGSGVGAAIVAMTVEHERS